MLHQQPVAELENADITLADACGRRSSPGSTNAWGDHAVHMAERARYLADGT